MSPTQPTPAELSYLILPLISGVLSSQTTLKFLPVYCLRYTSALLSLVLQTLSGLARRFPYWALPVTNRRH